MIVPRTGWFVLSVYTVALMVFWYIRTTGEIAVTAFATKAYAVVERIVGRGPAKAACLWSCAGVLAVLLSFLLYAPYPYPPVCMGRCRDVIGLSQAPFSMREFADVPYVGYRITMPLLGYLTGLRGKAVLLIPFLANVATFGILGRLCYLRFRAPLSILLVAGMATTAVAQTGNTWLGFPDPISNLCLALMLSTRSWMWQAVLTLAGCLNDERFLLGVPFVLVWHFGSLGLRAALDSGRKVALGMGCGIVGVLLVRNAIHVGFIGPGLEMRYDNSVGMVQGLTLVRALGFFCCFRAMLVLPLVAVFKVGAGRLWARLLVIVVLLGEWLATSYITGDMTRGSAAAYPAILCMTGWLADEKPQLCERLLAAAVVMNLVLPHVDAQTSGFYWAFPLPLVLLRRVAFS